MSPFCFPLITKRCTGDDVGEIDGVIKVYDGVRHLALFSSKKYEATFNRIIYLTSQKSGITNAMMQKSKFVLMILSL